MARLSSSSSPRRCPQANGWAAPSPTAPAHPLIITAVVPVMSIVFVGAVNICFLHIIPVVMYRYLCDM
ncbi:hypothetical protein PENTCL1PPCAC_3513 [Pristionchus entomophagus]|uniref:G protein-coupled receptor n=1 Tax=Pristionchus entomophagus TaxID=358040 RepID=A0AAV5SGL4_9BILA|nr:hypothetical protein PENTCL1PPCAC_3513 [Pristionchus entomophagus]